MVRTRATTESTPTPARQDASEPATGAVARRGVMARGRGRGRGWTSSKEEDKDLAHLVLGR